MMSEIISSSFLLKVNNTDTIREVVSDSFTLTIKESQTIHEILSSSFLLKINNNVDPEIPPSPEIPPTIPPEQIESLNQALEQYLVGLKFLRGKMQEAQNKIANEVFDSKTHEDIFNKLTDNGNKKAIIMENGELYINATYVKSGLLEGCILRTSPNGLGQHVYVEGDMYSIKDGVDTKAMFGFKSPISGQKSNIPFFAIGHDGVGYSYNYMAGVSYPAVYNPIGAKYAYAEWAYQFVKDNYTSIRFTANGEIEINPDYKLSIGRYYESGKRRELATVFEKNGNGCLGTYLVEAVDVLAKYLRSSETLYLESDGGDIGLVLYGGSEKAFQPQDHLTGQVQLGTPWGAWKNVFATNTYSSSGVFVNEVSATSQRINSVDDILDGIEFISMAQIDSSNLSMDVTSIKDTDYVEVSEKSDDIYINESELLKLALFEIKKLKIEVAELKSQLNS